MHRSAIKWRKSSKRKARSSVTIGAENSKRGAQKTSGFRHEKVVSQAFTKPFQWCHGDGGGIAWVTERMEFEEVKTVTVFSGVFPLERTEKWSGNNFQHWGKILFSLPFIYLFKHVYLLREREREKERENEWGRGRRRGRENPKLCQRRAQHGGDMIIRGSESPPHCLVTSQEKEPLSLSLSLSLSVSDIF